MNRLVAVAILLASARSLADAQVPLRTTPLQPASEYPSDALHRIQPRGVDCTSWDSDRQTSSGLQVLLQADVDTPPQLLKVGARRYPAALEMAGQGGSVVLRFVVDTLGHPEPCSFSTLMLTDAAFEEAAYLMVLDSRYRPAKHQGRKVPVLMTQRITFSP